LGIKNQQMTRLSVNINKIAVLRNSRGANAPNLIQVAQDCERFGAEGITIHPRPDERHIKYDDVFELKKIVTTEFNIEGNPTERKFVDLVLANKPTQVTLVPDAQNAITSNAGWDTIKHASFLKEILQEFKQAGIRTSIFVDPLDKMIQGAAEVGTDRIELYTENYAHFYSQNRENAIANYVQAGVLAKELDLRLNAGHDLNLENLRYFQTKIPHLAEVSIGHALICDALYYGLENTIQLYLRELN
jgi:pyridoxine 5-phosphate synthase